MKFKSHVHWKWFAQKNIAAMRVELYLMGDSVHGEVYQKRFEEAKIVKHEHAVWADNGPTMELDYDEAQFLADQLWEVGIKPKGSGAEQGVINAMQAHIDSLYGIIHMMMAGDPPAIHFDLGAKMAKSEQFSAKSGPES